MREKRKRGSTLITVLAVSLIFMALSGVILKSISGTMKLNINQKEREDLRYAAESGLEIARSYFKEDNKRISIDTQNGTQLEKKLDDILISGIVSEVNIKSEEVDGKIIVRSTAKHINGKFEETISNKYKKVIPKVEEGDIFDYGLIGGNGGIDVSVGGNSNLDTTIARPSENEYNQNVNGQVEKNPQEKDSNLGNIQFSNKMGFLSNDELRLTVKGYSNFEFEVNGENIKNSKLENKDRYLEIELNMHKHDSVTNTTKVDLSVNGEEDQHLTAKEYIMERINDKYVVVLKINLANSAIPMNIILVNAENIIITPSYGNMLDLLNVMILTTGNAYIRNVNNFGFDTKLTNSTILGKKVIFESEGNLHVVGQPSSKVNSNGEGSGILNEEEKNEINEIFKELFIGHENGNGEENNLNSSLIFEEKSFNNN